MPVDRIHVDRPPTCLGTTRQALERQPLRLEVQHHFMTEQGAEGVPSARHHQTHKGDGAAGSRVTVK